MCSFPEMYNEPKRFGEGYVIALSLQSVVPGFLSRCIAVTYTKTSLRSRDLKRFGYEPYEPYGLGKICSTNFRFGQFSVS